MPDDDFTPKLGKSQGNDGQRTLKYGARVLFASRLAEAKSSIRSPRFDGSRIRRGASIGRLLSSRDRLAEFRVSRAIVKASLVRRAGKGGRSARAHMCYVKRDGVTRDDLPGELYGPQIDHADGRALRRLHRKMSAAPSVPKVTASGKILG